MLSWQKERSVSANTEVTVLPRVFEIKYSTPWLSYWTSKNKCRTYQASKQKGKVGMRVRHQFRQYFYLPIFNARKQ